ncbi:hypothetical protein BDZ94DRAFT_896710 [Collybia nuda]|uniref:Uncharacterized protein n=1 Tax=Collybia nuda TaxID=64659 RepID=A0A9P5XZC6_9AGAR|nr:hypothetical protein BDZ94DRAFT_896710 [Collybia nuda]
MTEPLTDTLAVEDRLKEEIMDKPIQIQPPERIGFSNLPPEILFFILEPLRPVYERPALHCRSFYGMPRLDHNVDPVFKHNLQRFADMRLLCVQLDAIISQMVYCEIVVFIDDKMDMRKVAAMFEGGADHIRSVVIIGERTYHGWSQHSSQYSADTASIIAEGLRRCTNVQNLECYHNHHTFTSRRWLSTMTPTLAPSVTSLVLYATNLVLISPMPSSVWDAPFILSRYYNGTYLTTMICQPSTYLQRYQNCRSSRLKEDTPLWVGLRNSSAAFTTKGQ